MAISAASPGEHQRNDSNSGAADSHPGTGSSDRSLPGLAKTKPPIARRAATHRGATWTVSARAPEAA